MLFRSRQPSPKNCPNPFHETFVPLRCKHIHFHYTSKVKTRSTQPDNTRGLLIDRILLGFAGIYLCPALSLIRSLITSSLITHISRVFRPLSLTNCESPYYHHRKIIFLLNRIQDLTLSTADWCMPCRNFNCDPHLKRLIRMKLSHELEALGHDLLSPIRNNSNDTDSRYPRY
jgi:hypothetical protein